MAYHGICVQGGGVFVSPKSDKYGAKLRLLYECAPLALVVQAAGGRADCASGGILEQPVRELHMATTVVMGDAGNVEQCIACLDA